MLIYSVLDIIAIIPELDCRIPDKYKLLNLFG